MSNKLLEIKNLHVNVEDKEILKGIDLTINKGEIHVIMGPNGSGKTTTANAILNNPEYTKTNGTITFDGEDITESRTDEIARKGILYAQDIQKIALVLEDFAKQIFSGMK